MTADSAVPPTTETTTVRYLWRLRCEGCGFIEENRDEQFIREIATKITAGDGHNLVIERCPLNAWEAVEFVGAVRD